MPASVIANKAFDILLSLNGEDSFLPAMALRCCFYESIPFGLRRVRMVHQEHLYRWSCEACTPVFVSASPILHPRG